MIIRKSLAVVIAAAVLMAALPPAAQAPAAPAPKPLGPKVPASAALKQIPAGCMGFVVVNNVNAMCGKADNFLKTIGPGGQPFMPMSVLDMIKAQGMQLKLGEGFNPNGPFAVTMLDPQLYGVDLLQMLNLPGAKPAPAGEKQPEVPVVVLIPGKGLAKVLAAGGGEKEGEYLKSDDMYWKQVGSFVAGSPNKKALAAVAAVRKSVLTQLSPADKALIARNDAAVWVNFKIVGPIAQAALKKLEKAAEEGAGPTAGMGPALDMYASLFKELEDVALGLRFAKTGILIESRVSLLAEGTIGKALAATKVRPGALLDRLPKTPYVVAMGFRGTVVPKDLNVQMLDKFMAAGYFKGLSAEAKAKWRKVAIDLQEQITGVQLSAGAITGEEGQVGLVYVIECKSADKVRALLPDYVALTSEIYKATEDEKLSKVEIKYHKGLEAVGAIKLDAISIGHPDLAKMDESQRAKLKAILGEDKVRLLVGKADAKTLVITLGGGKKFMATAMETAKARSGKLGADPGTVAALAMLPKKPMGVGLLHLGNVFTVAKKVATALGEPPPPINIVAPTPLAGSMSIEKSDLLLVGYIPTDAIQGIVGAVMGAMMGGMMGGGGPMGF